MRAVSRRISGLSPVQPRRPPVCSISGESAEVVGDDLDRVVDDDRLVGPEVVDVRAGLVVMVLGGREDRRDAVSDVQVGLLLAPVAEHAQAGRVALERTVEVEHVPVRVALAEDRDEAADQPGEAVAGRVGRDQALAGQLRCAVQRGLDRERGVLGGGEDLGLAVDRAGRGEHDPARPPRRASPRARSRSRSCSARGRVGDARGRGARRRWPAGERPSRSPRLRPRARPSRARRPRRASRRPAQRLGDELPPSGAEVVDDHDLDALRRSAGRRGCCR